MSKMSKSRGFSIIEVLVAAAILGVLSFAFIQFLGGAMKGQKNVQNAVDFDILKTSLNLVMNTKACDGAFRRAGSLPQITLPSGQSWSTLALGTNVIGPTAPLSIDQVVQGSSVVAEINKELGGGLKITKMDFTVATYDGTQTVVDPVTSASTIYRAFASRFRLEVTKQGPNSLGAPGYSTELGVRILVRPDATAANGIVEKCSTSSNAGSEVPPGMVGIGGKFAIHTNPQTPLRTLMAATQDCASRGFSLCSSEQWYQACVAAPAELIGTRVRSGTNWGPGDAGSFTSGEWVSSVTHVYGIIMNCPMNSSYGQDICSSGNYEFATQPRSYRCCKNLN